MGIRLHRHTASGGPARLEQRHVRHDGSFPRQSVLVLRRIGTWIGDDCGEGYIG